MSKTYRRTEPRRAPRRVRNDQTRRALRWAELLGV